MDFSNNPDNKSIELLLERTKNLQQNDARVKTPCQENEGKQCEFSLNISILQFLDVSYPTPLYVSLLLWVLVYFRNMQKSILISRQFQTASVDRRTRGKDCYTSIVSDLTSECT